MGQCLPLRRKKSKLLREDSKTSVHIEKENEDVNKMEEIVKERNKTEENVEEMKVFR
jgi:hypothetical protein